MTAGAFQHLADAFNDALELESAARDAFLERRLGGNPEALAEVKRLIALHEGEARDAGFLAHAPAPVPDAADTPAFASPWPQPADGIGQHIGPYRILDTLGEGGMGVVYLAEQEAPIRRTVAIKVIKPGMDSREVLARFKAEVDVLARLEHPGIARVLDAGQVDASASAFGGDRPYLVMEYIGGPRTRNITTYCAEHRLTVNQRLELIESLCHALEHCHSRGVIHRDIKPSNVLVTEIDGMPQPRIIDFGVAKALMPSRAGSTMTEHGQLLGTLEYLSPEQARAGPVDARTDIYSLGVLTYELIAGALPLEPAELSMGGDDALHVIRNADRPMPSDRFAALDANDQRTIASIRGLTAQELRKCLRHDLDAVICKAIQPDRERRYASASAMAGDIRALISGRPVAARPARRIWSAAESLVRRSMGGVVAAAAVVALVLLTWGVAGRTAALAGAVALGVAGVIWGLARSLAAAAEARRQRDTAERLRNEAQLARVESERQRDQARHQAYVACMVAADAAMRDHAYTAARRRLSQAPAALRRWEWFHLRSQLADRSLATLRGHSSWVAGIACSSDGRHIASASRDATVRLWDLRTHELIRTLRGHDDLVQSVAFSRDGSMLVSGSWDRTVRIWDVNTGELRRTLHGHDGWIAAVAVSPDGRTIASGCSDGCVRLWDARTGAMTDTLCSRAGVIYAITFSNDGRTIAFGGEDTVVHLWDAAACTPMCALRGHSDWVRSIAFSPDSRIIASASADSTIRLWDVTDGKELATLRGHGDRVYSIAFNGDATVLASGSSDSTIRLWNIAALLANEGRDAAGNVGDVAARSTVLHGHDARVFAVAFAPDGNQLASGSEDATLKLWSANSEAGGAVLRGAGGPVFSVALSPDGLTVAAGSGQASGRAIDLWRAASEQRLLVQRDAGEADDSHAAGTIALWDARSGALLRAVRGHTAKVSSVAFSPDGSVLASASYDRTIKLWNVLKLIQSSTEAKPIATLTGHAAWVFSIAFSGDSRWLASGAGDRTVRLWDLRLLHAIEHGDNEISAATTLRGHYDRVNGVAFSPDGRHLASGSSDGTVKIWNLNAADTAVATLSGHNGWVLALAFSDDGRMLASGSSDNTIRLWDLSELAAEANHSPRIVPLATCRGHGTWVFSLAFTADGSRLASGSWDNTVKLWDPATGEELATLRGHSDRVNTVAFSRDGSVLASGSWDQTIRLWSRDSSAER